jgi:hypothetical protein
MFACDVSCSYRRIVAAVELVAQLGGHETALETGGNPRRARSLLREVRLGIIDQELHVGDQRHELGEGMGLRRQRAGEDGLDIGRRISDVAAALCGVAAQRRNISNDCLLPVRAAASSSSVNSCVAPSSSSVQTRHMPGACRLER